MLAHELSHIANRDVLIMTLASFFALSPACWPAGVRSSAAAATATEAFRSG